MITCTAALSAGAIGVAGAWRTPTTCSSFLPSALSAGKLASWLDTLQTNGLPARRRPSNRHKLKNPHDWTPSGYLPDTTPGA